MSALAYNEGSLAALNNFFDKEAVSRGDLGVLLAAMGGFGAYHNYNQGEIDRIHQETMAHHQRYLQGVDDLKRQVQMHDLRRGMAHGAASPAFDAKYTTPAPNVPLQAAAGGSAGAAHATLPAPAPKPVPKPAATAPLLASAKIR